MADYTPELGQMLSGASYTGISTPRYVTDGINAIDNLLLEHLYGVRPVKFEYGTFPDNDMSAVSNTGYVHDLPGAPFSMQAYDWSEDCTCGFEDHEYEVEKQVLHDLQYPEPNTFELDDSRWATFREVYRETLHKTGFEDHTDECRLNIPNFLHFESGFKVYWYKHSLRGSTTNRDISQADWRKVQKECEDWVLSQPRAFRVLITGSRDFASECFTLSPPNRKGRKYKTLRDDFAKVESPGLKAMVGALREARKAANGAHMTVVHGGASGADQLSGALTHLVSNAHTEIHRALWNRDSNGGYDRTAGFKRNERMVDSGVDLCLAFFKNGAGNNGTKHCSDLARKRGIEVMEVWSD